MVLEFWATWCSPCVASLPHLNQLVESLDPTKFQFISIDDEDLKAVQSFLTKKKMSGWVGVDASGGRFWSTVWRPRMGKADHGHCQWKREGCRGH